MPRQFTLTYSRSGMPLLFFLVLFLIYHVPELLQNYFHKPLILVLELVMLLFTAIAFYFGRQFHHNGLKLYGLFSFGRHWRNLTKGMLIGMLIAVLATSFRLGSAGMKFRSGLTGPNLFCKFCSLPLAPCCLRWPKTFLPEVTCTPSGPKSGS